MEICFELNGNTASKKPRRKALLGFAVTALTCLSITMTGQALAQAVQGANAYPNHPVKLVIPFPPGGATDVIGRLVAQRLGEAWGQTVIVENRSGASGAIGSASVAKSAPDGYTLLVGTTSSHGVSPAINPKLPYQISDFSPITLLATFPNVIVVHPSVAKTLPELIALAKANPGKLSFASSGHGSSTHLTGELFNLMSGTNIVHVPYKGSNPLLNDLVAGHIPMAVDQLASVMPFVQAGRIRAIGITSLERSNTMPEVPTVREVVPGFEANAWVGIFAPASTPPAIMQKIARDTGKILASPDIVQKLKDLGAAPVGDSPDQFLAFVKKDVQKWRELAKSANITAEN
jgi:tripartite-type tricarboxylate transporter receptor subunit TctC